MLCYENIQNRIIRIYDNDGPGFSNELIQSEKYNRIREKIVRIIPEFCVIGMLFENNTEYKIVKSSAEGILQHDGMTWQILGDTFVEKKELSPKSKLYNEIINTWIENVDLKQRITFTRDFFLELVI